MNRVYLRLTSAPIRIATKQCHFSSSSYTSTISSFKPSLDRLERSKMGLFSSKTAAINGLESLNPVRLNSTAQTVDNTEIPPIGGPSVDPEEMKRFKRMAESWWIKNGAYEALHRMNVLRVPLVRDTLVNSRTNSNVSMSEQNYTKEELEVKPLLGFKILDVGCGGGILSEPLARLGAEVTAIDACKENIIAAQLRAESEQEKRGEAGFYERLNYINCTLEDLAAVPDNTGYFDAIVMSEVVEHVNNLKEFISNSSSLLKNHGFSFITTINRTPLSYALAIVGAEYVLNIVPRGTHTWEKFVKPDELKSFLEPNEMFVKFKMGMHYNPLTQNWSWSNDTSVNYAIFAQKFAPGSN